ncbi:hypothetical protein [Cellulomonas soli]|uniref:Uncharacterized protein n=1 Tax=Cellulomonas soli TaxID=931535 RepID=A0A512PFW6_9CELL|nr:hypothetical protein [Cellulomonas soli]NYI59761.1 hypothetical protein [Cellulomonas soli]GEP70097.1 hypothetical protein CSO01_28120 [Cellulomonas soli]
MSGSLDLAVRLVTSLAAAAPSPSPSDVLVSDSEGGSPGFLGFVFTFALAVACVGLFLSLTRQLRVVDRRAKQLEDEDEDEDEGQDVGEDGDEVGPTGEGTQAGSQAEDDPAEVEPADRTEGSGR